MQKKDTPGPKASQPAQNVESLLQLFRYIHEDLSAHPALVNVAAAVHLGLLELERIRRQSSEKIRPAESA